jgi:hypothetical protein
MPNIKIDDKEYDLDSISADAKAQIEMLLATDNKIRELQRDLAIAQTARNAYGKALTGLLDMPVLEMPVGDTIKLS